MRSINLKDSSSNGGKRKSNSAIYLPNEALRKYRWSFLNYRECGPNPDEDQISGGTDAALAKRPINTRSPHMISDVPTKCAIKYG